MNLQDMLEDGTLKNYPYCEDLPVIVETRSGIAEIEYSTGRSEQRLAELVSPDRIHLARAMCSKFNGHPPEYKEFASMFAKDISEIRKAGNNLKGGLDPFIELDCIEYDTSYSILIYRIPDFFYAFDDNGQYWPVDEQVFFIAKGLGFGYQEMLGMPAKTLRWYVEQRG